MVSLTGYIERRSLLGTRANGRGLANVRIFRSGYVQDGVDAQKMRNENSLALQTLFYLSEEIRVGMCVLYAFSL
jgi:hypothetical protein